MEKGGLLFTKGGMHVKNMRDIAKEAGVGIATISRYINGTGYVSDEARERIEKVIKKSNYKPNELARAIFSKNSKVIGLLVPNISNPYFNELALIIEDYVSNQGFSMFLCNTNDDPEKEKNYIHALQGHRVAGMIAVRGQCKNEYSDYPIPVVSFENHISDEIITVVTDNYMGGRLAFNVLFENGCRNLAHIKGPGFSDATIDRTRGFLDGAKEKNLTVEIIQFETDFHRNMLEVNSKALESIGEFDGIFIFNDIAAAAVIRYFKQKNVKIPEEMQIVGFDNSYIGQFLYPSLTTIEQSIHDVAKKTSETLLSLIKGEHVEEKIITIKPKLIIRETTKNIESAIDKM